MATITKQDIDISEYFGKEKGTVIYAYSIEEKGLPRAAVLIDHKEKGLYLYEHKESEDAIALSPIEDDEVLAKLQEIVQKESVGEED
ncbi:hypothetical protein QO179_24225 [Bacillus stercoris]|nr:hypothetical protein [Bacillus stercoris]